MKKVPNHFIIKYQMFYAFKLGRRSQMWLTFRTGFSERFWFLVFKIFFSKNMIHERKFRKKSGIWSDDVFLFRNEKSAERFKKAQEMDWSGDPYAKNRLYGEALGYPEFAIDDFKNLLKNQKELFDGRPKPGDRISVKCFEYGYDSIVCRPENYKKMKKWLESQGVPLIKCIFSINETGRWEHFSFEEFEDKIKLIK